MIRSSSSGSNSKWKTSQRKRSSSSSSSSRNKGTDYAENYSLGGEEESNGTLSFLNGFVNPQQQQQVSAAPRSSDENIDDILDFASGRSESQRDSTSSTISGISGLSGNLDAMKEQRRNNNGGGAWSSGDNSSSSSTTNKSPRISVKNRKKPTLTRCVGSRGSFSSVAARDRAASKLEEAAGFIDLQHANTDDMMISPSQEIIRNYGDRKAAAAAAGGIITTTKLTRSKGSKGSFGNFGNRGEKILSSSRLEDNYRSADAVGYIPPQEFRNQFIPPLGETVNKNSRNNIVPSSAVEHYDHDAITPIPVFTVPTGPEGQHDDDISQITTSITSHYDNTTIDQSSRSSWSRGIIRNSGGGRSGSHSESSYADTLDEIADMMGNNNNNNEKQQQHRHSYHYHRQKSHPGTTTNNGNAISTDDDFFGTTAASRSSPNKIDDLFNPTTIAGSSSNNHYHTNNRGSGLFSSYNNHRDPTLSPDEVYRTTNRRTSLIQQFHVNKTILMAHIEPFLSSVRLLIRYWVSLIFPHEWRNNRVAARSKKDDGSVWNSSSKKIRLTRSMRRQRWLTSFVAVAIIFFFMTVIIFIFRLIFLHGAAVTANNNSSSNNNNMRMRGRNDSDKLKNAEVHGRMSGRNPPDIRDVNSNDNEKMQALPEEKEIFSSRDNERDEEHMGLSLPKELDYIADIDDWPRKEDKDIPFYWHIPRAGGGTVHDIFGMCLGLTIASDAGAKSNLGNELSVVKSSTTHIKHVNVDTSTKEGIERASKLHLGESGLVDLIISTHLFTVSSQIFTKNHKGRLFTVMRHPVDRAVSLFHYIQDTQWRMGKNIARKELTNLSLEDYMKSGFAENNWMIKFLINDPQKAKLDRSDVQLAKEILRRKFLVGLLEEKGETIARFEKYFGFTNTGEENNDCHGKNLDWNWPLKHRHEKVDENTPLWDSIMEENNYDMELYRYVKDVLFNEQAKLFSSSP